MQHEASQAKDSLSELDRLFDMTRLASRSMATGFPLVGWGIAWVVGFAGVDLVDGPARILIGALAWLTGMLLSWWPKRATIRPGTHKPMRRAWLVVFVASPFVVAAARPESWSYALLLLGALWGLAMCLYAVATADRVFAVVAGIAVVAAGVVATSGLAHPLLTYGLAAGLPMVTLGVTRVVQGGSCG